MTSSNNLEEYLRTLAKLHRNTHKARGPAPHKPVFLLAVLHEIEAGRITSNLVYPSVELVSAFRLYWEALVPQQSGWAERMAYPFRYLRQDGFWKLVENGQLIIPESGRDYTLNQLAEMCDGGVFDDTLWQLLEGESDRIILRQHLLKTYFNDAVVVVTRDRQLDYIYSQANQLKQQANARFVQRRVREPNDEGYYIRNRLFPMVVKELYDFSCCVCSLNTKAGSGNSVVDAAHIMPFADFHNNDPRNGIALCKNHHWGFDCGVWSLNDKHQILLSPSVTDDSAYVKLNAVIGLPSDSQFWPDPVALDWHRRHWGFI